MNVAILDIKPEVCTMGRMTEGPYSYMGVVTVIIDEKTGQTASNWLNGWYKGIVDLYGEEVILDEELVDDRLISFSYDRCVNLKVVYNHMTKMAEIRREARAEGRALEREDQDRLRRDQERHQERRVTSCKKPTDSTPRYIISEMSEGVHPEFNREFRRRERANSQEPWYNRLDPRNRRQHWMR